MSYNSLSSIPSSLLSVWSKPKNGCPKSCWTLTLADCAIPILISPLLDSSQPLSTGLLLVLDVPLSYGVTTVVAAFILCIMSREFHQKQRHASFSQTCYFYHEIALNWDVPSRCYHLFWLPHHTLDGKYTSSTTSYGKRGLKTCTATGPYSSPQMKPRERERNHKVFCYS